MEVASKREHMMSLVATLVGSCGDIVSISGSGGSGGHVERRFCCSCSRWHLMLASTVGTSLFMMLVESPGNDDM